MNRVVCVVAVAAIAAEMLGCGGGHADVPGLPEDFTGPGSYTVPAVPSVEFAIARVRIEQNSGAVSLYYEIPAALVGKKTWVETTGSLDATTGALKLSGAAGTSTCSVSPALLRCEEDLPGVPIAAPLAGSSSDPEIAAARAFQADPIGVLSVILPPSSP
jgi:hypothetical protein